jgi:uncharacterized RmlC-like cupin family protein
MNKLQAELDWATITPWSKSTPFPIGAPKKPTVIERRNAHLASWGPDPDGRHRTPCWIHTSTETIGFVCTMSVAPGDFFEVGNHPNVETYYQMAGVLHVSNPDTGQVCAIHPGEAFIMPAFQYHIGYNFSTDESLTLAVIPGDSHTAEFQENPLLEANYNRKQVALFGGATRNEGFNSHLLQLGEWPPIDTAVAAHKKDFVLMPRSKWLQVIFGVDPRSAVLGSFYYSTPQLGAYTVLIPPNRISVAHSLSGETVIYVQHRDIIVDILNSGDALYGEEGDAIFIPPGVPFQYQNRGDQPVEVQVITAPWEGATIAAP